MRGWGGRNRRLLQRAMWEGERRQNGSEEGRSDVKEPASGNKRFGICFQITNAGWGIRAMGGKGARVGLAVVLWGHGGGYMGIHDTALSTWQVSKFSLSDDNDRRFSSLVKLGRSLLGPPSLLTPTAEFVGFQSFPRI